MTIFEILSLLIGFGGMTFVAGQLREQARATKAQLLLKLGDEWRDESLYQAIRYVHDLREDWKLVLEAKATGNGSLDAERVFRELACDWVRSHLLREKANNPEQLASEWMQRRRVSQFLDRLASLCAAGYLTQDEMFQIIPEAGRLLVVLIPIELEIERQCNESGRSLADWDRSIPKWEIASLKDDYETWYRRHRRRLTMTPQVPLLPK